MLIKCFSDPRFVKEGNRKGEQMMQKHFTLSENLDFLSDIDYGTKEYKEFKERCYKASVLKKHKLKTAFPSCDALYELELLGIERYSKQYTIAIDFVDCLDFILAALTGCSIESVQALEDYKKVSRDMLTFRLEDSETVPLSSIVELDINIKLWFTGLIFENRSKDDSSDLKDTVYSVLYEFYSAVMGLLERIKNYVGGVLSDADGIVYRSKSYSSIILSADSPFPDECITLEIEKDGKVYHKDVKVFTFTKGEYSRKVGAGEIEYIM